MPYGYIASMKCQDGKRDEVIEILVSGADGLRPSGASRYIVAADAGDEVTIWVTEVWESKEAHDASLQLPEAKAAIARAMPMLTGDFTGVETEIRGGLGL